MFFVFFVFVYMDSHGVVVFCGWSLINIDFVCFYFRWPVNVGSRGTASEFSVCCCFYPQMNFKHYPPFPEILPFFRLVQWHHSGRWLHLHQNQNKNKKWRCAIHTSTGVTGWGWSFFFFYCLSNILHDHGYNLRPNFNSQFVVVRQSGGTCMEIPLIVNIIFSLVLWLFYVKLHLG